MMPRKKRRTIIIVSILMVLILIVITLVFLYLTTDMLKSDSTLFVKYIGQNIENIQSTYQKIEEDEYKELLEQNKYTTKTKVKINATEEIGTTSENTQNSINQLSLESNGQTDKVAQYNYQDIQILNNDKKIAQVEYLQNEAVYGVRFSGLFREFILVNQEKMKEMLEQNNLPNHTELNELKNAFQFSEEEEQNLKNKYISIVNNNVAKENFSKQKNQSIEIDKKKVNVNAYTLTLTKEQMNHIYIKMLEELKQDEIILMKMDKLQTLLANYQTEEINLRQEFTKKIEELITNITKNNIGQEEAKITVYENYHNTVRTLIQNPEYEITIDVLSLTNQNGIQIAYQDIANKKEQILTYKKEEGETTASFSKKEGEKTTQYSLVSNQKVEGNSCEKNIVAKYEDNSNRVEAIIEQKMNIINEFEEEIKTKEENYINLSELEEEQAQSIVEQVTNAVSKKVEELTTTTINIEDLREVLKIVGVVPSGQTIQGSGVTETEKKRFNSKFEILQGEKLEENDVLRLIEAIKENFVDMEIVSNTELKLKLDRLNKKEELATQLSDFIKANRNRKYNAKVEYDEETGLVSDILLIMLER